MNSLGAVAPQIKRRFMIRKTNLSVFFMVWYHEIAKNKDTQGDYAALWTACSYRRQIRS